jgi:hypothetical protein
VFLFFIYVNFQNFYDLIFLLIKDCLKILKKNILLHLHWKFAEEKIKTHEKYDYKDIFILISKNLTPDVKAKKWENGESCEKKQEHVNSLYTLTKAPTLFKFYFVHFIFHVKSGEFRNKNELLSSEKWTE